MNAFYISISTSTRSEHLYQRRTVDLTVCRQWRDMTWEMAWHSSPCLSQSWSTHQLVIMLGSEPLVAAAAPSAQHCCHCRDGYVWSFSHSSSHPAFPVVCMCLFVCTSVSCACVSSLRSLIPSLSRTCRLCSLDLPQLRSTVTIKSSSNQPASQTASSSSPSAATVWRRTITAEMASDDLLVSHCPVNYLYASIQHQFCRWSAVITDNTKHCKSSTGNQQRRSFTFAVSTTTRSNTPFLPHPLSVLPPRDMANCCLCLVGCCCSCAWWNAVTANER